MHTVATGSYRYALYEIIEYSIDVIVYYTIWVDNTSHDFN